MITDITDCLGLMPLLHSKKSHTDQLGFHYFKALFSTMTYLKFCVSAERFNGYPCTL